MPLGTLSLYLLATFWQTVFCWVFWRLFANDFDTPIYVQSFKFLFMDSLPKQLEHDMFYFDPAEGGSPL